jgi:endonuclease-3
MIQSTQMVEYQPIYDALIALYGEPTWRQHLSPVDELISTILSQNTNDNNRDVAFHRLKERFGNGSWSAVRDASLSDVVEAIRPAGLAQQKAPRIQNMLRVLSEQEGAISLDFLADMPLEDAREWLVSLPGVGPKTAAIVLLFAFGRPAFPVDTHIHRVAGRLGLIPSTLSAEKAHAELERIVPSEHYYALHLNLIRHGREVCRARNPLCQTCGLQDHCSFYRPLAGSTTG